MADFASKTYNAVMLAGANGKRAPSSTSVASSSYVGSDKGVGTVKPATVVSYIGSDDATDDDLDNINLGKLITNELPQPSKFRIIS